MDLEKRVIRIENSLSTFKASPKPTTKSLTVNRESILRDNVDKAKQLFSFTEEGEFQLITDIGQLNIEEKMALYLIAKAYAKLEGHSETDDATNQEISGKMRIPYNSTKGGAANKLRNQRVIVSTHGKHRIEYGKIEQLLDSFLGRREG